MTWRGLIGQRLRVAITRIARRKKAGSPDCGCNRGRAAMRGGVELRGGEGSARIVMFRGSTGIDFTKGYNSPI